MSCNTTEYDGTFIKQRFLLVQRQKFLPDGPPGQAECYYFPAFTALPDNDCYFKYVV